MVLHRAVRNGGGRGLGGSPRRCSSTTAKALREEDTELAARTLARARSSEHALDALRDLSAEGIAVVRLSPFRRRHLPAVQAIADLLEPLDHSIRVRG